MLIELLAPDTGRAFRAMQVLRPGLADEQAFVAQVDERQRAGGYRLVAVVPDEQGPALAVAGLRRLENLAWGPHLYVDDLSTVPEARNQGHAGSLLRWLTDEGRRLGCREIHLDSGVGPQRFAAHRLYLNAGYGISSHHFSLRL